jgi:DNA-binding response OmpR family regulator
MGALPSAPMPKILVVEDEPAIAESLAYSLRRDGFAVTVAASFAAAEREAPFADLVILDMMLPDGSGFDLIGQIRRGQRSSTAIIVLSSRDGEADRVAALETGADDYVAKPFSPRELTARVKAVLRRSGGVGSAADARDMLELGPVVLARGAREVRVHGAEVELTQREFDLLEYLLRHAGQVVSRDQLLESVWGFRSPGETRTVEVHVAQLRKKLGHADLIRTVRGLGYKAVL